jgi:hypothetical protein
MLILLYNLLGNRLVEMQQVLTLHNSSGMEQGNLSKTINTVICGIDREDIYSRGQHLIQENNLSAPVALVTRGE